MRKKWKIFSTTYAIVKEVMVFHRWFYVIANPLSHNSWNNSIFPISYFDMTVYFAIINYIAITARKCISKMRSRFKRKSFYIDMIDFYTEK